jgi:hypothetical protein
MVKDAMSWGRGILVKKFFDKSVPRAAILETTKIGRYLEPGCEYVKAWKVMNEGDLVIPHNVSIELVKGYVPAFRFEIFPPTDIQPGQTADITLTFQTASAHGIKQKAVWRFTNEAGRKFGQRFLLKYRTTPTP